MKISTRSEYAAKALLYLVLAEEGRTDHRPAQIPAIAGECDIPLKYLEQILVALRNHGILGSRRGVAGGYFLMRSADKITMGEVVRLMDGSNSIAGNLPDCQRDDAICASIRDLWSDVDRAVSSTLESVTFAHLRDQVKKRREERDLSSIMFYI